MTKRSRSILQSFGAFAQTQSSEERHPEAAASGDPAPSPASVARVGAGVIGATQRSLSDLREERDRLRALVEAGISGELDPQLVDPSPYPDRLADDDSASFDAFKVSIAEEGQKVPIQVRKHPAHAGRYQVVYGHRRLRAASELGVKVKALVIELSDAELAIAQGLENATRQDLSWIERAVFAGRMDEAGIRPRDIRAALSIDDPELARLRAVRRALPLDVLMQIGRAPKAGRPRWMALASAIDAHPALVDRIRETLSGDKVSGTSSDQRFSLAYQAIKMPAPSKSRVELLGPDGRTYGEAIFSSGAVKLSVKAAKKKQFEAFIRGELPNLMVKFFTLAEEE